MAEAWCVFLQDTLLTENNIDNTHQWCQLSDFALTFQTTHIFIDLLAEIHAVQPSIASTTFLRISGMEKWQKQQTVVA
jgi:hypothetical protein